MKLRPVLIGVGLTTLAILMLELALTRLFSATLYYHLAFLAISIALLGSGASGVFVYLFKQRLPAERTTLWLSIFLGRSSVRSPRSTLFLAYFGCLGAAFIIVELAMMQKFILFLGHPVYSLAAADVRHSNTFLYTS